MLLICSQTEAKVLGKEKNAEPEMSKHSNITFHLILYGTSTAETKISQ